MAEEKALVVICTAPSQEVGEDLAHHLVQARLAACVNIVGGLRSLYWWKGEIQRDREVLLIIKTHAGRVGALTGAIRERHPYEVPEVLALPVEHGSAEYLEWLRQSVARPAP